MYLSLVLSDFSKIELYKNVNYLCHEWFFIPKKSSVFTERLRLIFANLSTVFLYLGWVDRLWRSVNLSVATSPRRELQNQKR